MELLHFRMKVDRLTTLHLPADSLCGLRCRLQRFLLVTIMLAVTPVLIANELQIGNSYSVTFKDVDQRQLSISDGHITIITVVTREDEQKAQTVGDRFSHSHLGDPKCRLITVVNFQQKIIPIFRRLALTIIRRRLEAEAKEVKQTYPARYVDRNPRDDLFVVADFDGKAVSQLDIVPTSKDFAVFVFDGNGRLIKRWNDVPSPEALATAIEEAHKGKEGAASTAER